MIKAFSVVLAGLITAACHSASATDIGKELKSTCRALPGIDDVSQLEVMQACKTWLEQDPADGDLYYYFGRAILENGDPDRAMELFEEGRQRHSQLATDAYWFAQQGSLIGGVKPLSGEVLQHFRSEAEDGKPVGEVLMGLQIGHFGQKGAEQESRQQRKALFKSASDAGEPIATYLLGVMMVYDDNRENDGEGVRLLRVAAEEGVGIAYEDLQDLGEIEEVPVDYLSTRYRSAAPVDLVMRRP